MATQSAGLTGEGKILGTLQYMAPEQLEGKDADARTDIFAFGATVYEMVTGQKAFEGTSQASLIGAILKDAPRAMSSLQSLTPPMLDQVVQMCLAKDPNDRWQNAGDLGRQFKLSAEHGSQIGVPASTTPTSGPASSRWIAWGLGLVAVTGWLFAAWAAIDRDQSLLPSRVTRFTLELPGPQQVYNKTTASALVISRDGRRVAWIGDGDNEPIVYTRAIDGLDVRTLEGARGIDTTAGLALSPDGEWVAFPNEMLYGVPRSLKPFGTTTCGCPVRLVAPTTPPREVGVTNTSMSRMTSEK